MVKMNNPYNNSDSPKMLPSFVCYADILGFSHLSKEAIKSDNGPHFLNTIHHALCSAYDRIRKHSKGFRDNPAYAVKVFTDNIVIGYPLHGHDLGHGEIELADILIIFSEFQAGLAMEGFFLRGGIAFGDHYMDDDIVFGDALIDAVNQDKSGGAPCISLTKSAIDKVRRQLAFYGDEPDWAPDHYHLLEDADGTIFINYLDDAFRAFPDGGPFFETIEKHQQNIIRGLNDYKGKPGVRAKYEWAARYHNYVCRDFAESHPKPNDPDCEEIDVLAHEEAQKLLDFTIDIESLAATPGRMRLAPY